MRQNQATQPSARVYFLILIEENQIDNSRSFSTGDQRTINESGSSRDNVSLNTDYCLQ
jgi:hypothetical protein